MTQDELDNDVDVLDCSHSRHVISCNIIFSSCLQCIPNGEGDTVAIPIKLSRSNLANKQLYRI